MNRLWVRLSLVYTATTGGILTLIVLFISQTAGNGAVVERLPEGLSAADRALFEQVTSVFPLSSRCTL